VSRKKDRNRDRNKRKRIAHTKERAKERYQFELEREDYNRLSRMIIEKKGSEQAKSGESAIWLVAYKGKIWRIVWNEVHRHIQTVLPLDQPDWEAGHDPENPFKDLLQIRGELPKAPVSGKKRPK
jgi:hypothetical protein